MDKQRVSWKQLGSHLTREDEADRSHRCPYSNGHAPLHPDRPHSPVLHGSSPSFQIHPYPLTSYISRIQSAVCIFWFLTGSSALCPQPGTFHSPFTGQTPTHFSTFFLLGARDSRSLAHPPSWASSAPPPAPAVMNPSPACCSLTALQVPPGRGQLPTALPRPPGRGCGSGLSPSPAANDALNPARVMKSPSPPVQIMGRGGGSESF